MKDILTLGIESSCDETSVSVVKNGREVLSNVINSQIDIHTIYGGVVPEIASRCHTEVINQITKQALKEANVNTDYVLRTDKANTGLAFVSLKEDGNRDFSFYRNPSADMLLEENEVKKEWFKDCHSLHFCSVDLIECPMKYAHKKAIEFALENKSIISFDPNVRLPLWDSEESCRDAILEFLHLAHIVKISDEELEFITGYDTMDKAKEVLFKGNVKLVLFTKGKDGAEAHTKDKTVKIHGSVVDVVDTTGVVVFIYWFIFI